MSTFSVTPCTFDALLDSQPGLLRRENLALSTAHRHEATLAPVGPEGIDKTGETWSDLHLGATHEA